MVKIMSAIRNTIPLVLVALWLNWMGISLAWTPLFLVAEAAIAWLVYAAIMAFKANLANLGKTQRYTAYTLLFIVGYPFDVLMNLQFGTASFMELPPILKTHKVIFGRAWTLYYPELLFTSRCDRHLEGPDGWRKNQAEYWCRNWLDPLLQGGHCKQPTKEK